MNFQEGEQRLADIQDNLAAWAHEYDQIAERHSPFHPERIRSAGKGMLVATKAAVDFIPVLPTLFKARNS